MLVFDASTLILVAKIELLDMFLDTISMEAVIPREVERECCGVKKTVDALSIQKAIEQARIKVIQVKDKRLVGKLQADFGLGKGEAEAVALALTKRAEFIGIDDKNGISACRLLGLMFTNALGILIRSHEKNLLSLSEAHAKLALLAQFGRYKHVLIEDARLRLESGK